MIELVRETRPIDRVDLIIIQTRLHLSGVQTPNMIFMSNSVTPRVDGEPVH
jgi:hypothetical protein